MIGQTVSHYRIVEELGGGGMGVVYKALDLRLNRFVAIKFLSSELTRDPHANQRFRQEAQAASALDHPNICTIHEIDETPSGELFLTMAYYEGETLKARIARGPLSTAEALDSAIQVAEGLARAHQSGIVHRDIKPANLMITADGVVKIVDFGLAKLTGASDATRTGTQLGTVLGTVAYMSPEQARGEDLDARTDVWSFGVVLHEMLTGQRPFAGKDDVAILSNILHAKPEPRAARRVDVPPRLEQIISKAIDRDVASRYRSASELLADLTSCRAAMSASSPKSSDLLRLLRRPVVAASLVVALLAIGIPSAIWIKRAADTRWARDIAIPQVRRFIEADDAAAAFALAKQAEPFLPGDPVLAGLWNQFSATGSIGTTPAGADVYVQAYAAIGEAWERLGSTPLQNVRLPRGVFLFRVEKDGFEPEVLAARFPGPAITITLPPKGTSPGMVPVSGGTYTVGLTGVNSEQTFSLEPFLMDRYEVTNKDFKAFIQGGGYAAAKNWNGQDVHLFVDSTGRPGPATWELGEYPAGQADYPVGGVSWYEAAAYCSAVGKTLPTIYHWARAALSLREIGSALAPAIVPLSNFAGKGLAPVGSYRGVGPYGTYDMAGNAREWVWNAAASERRWIPGGAWNDPDYMFTVPTSLPPLDRSAPNGFRCARYDEAVPQALLTEFNTYSRDHRTAKAVSNEVYGVFKGQYARVRSPLNARVDARDTSRDDWISETLTFDAGYDNERMTSYLFLPKHAEPPFQVVIFFAGLGSFTAKSSSAALAPTDYLVKSGRAFVFPIYKGSYERWDPFISLQGEEYLRTFRTRMFQWRQDLSRTIDVLSARPDIDAGKIAYFGNSFGASTAFPLLALEDRLKAAVLAPGGFTYREMPPEADAINYVSHVTMPVLLVGGNHDYIFPLETAQKPMFERLGTSADRKRHVVFDAGHGNFPRSEMIREVLGWLDRYLGPVKVASPAR